MRSQFSVNFSVLVITLLTFFILKVKGQDQFEGIIHYAISNSGEKEVNIPHEMDYYLKNNNMMVRIYTENGDEMARLLLNGGTNTLFMIDDAQKTALKIHFKDNSEKPSGDIPDQYRNTYEQAIKEQQNKSQQIKPALIPTEITEIIAGYKCMKYKIENNIQQDQSISFIWLTEDIHFSFPDRMITEDNPLSHFIGQTGFPLKLHVSTNEGSKEMIATRIDQKKLNDNLFVVPADYNISDISSFMMNR